MNLYNTFTWTGINKTGNKITGKITSNNKVSALHELHKNDVIVLSIKKNIMQFNLSLSKKFSRKHCLHFTQHLHLLLETGLTLVECLTLMITMTEEEAFKKIITTLRDNMMSGHSFASALSNHPDHFDTVYCKIIAAGEQCGQVNFVLEQLIENIENQIHTQEKISKALFYPLCMMGIGLIICIALLIFVIPQFQQIYANFSAPLPLLTQKFIDFSNTLITHKVCFLSILMLLIFLCKTIFHKKQLQLAIRNVISCLPIIHSMMITKEITRWSQICSIALSSGIPLIETLHIANHTVTNPKLNLSLQKTTQSITTGQTFYAALSHCDDMTSEIKKMIGMGENADALAFMLKKIARYHQKKLNDKLDRLSKLLEPVIMIAVASLISGLIIAMYLPVFQIGNAV